MNIKTGELKDLKDLEGINGFTRLTRYEHEQLNKMEPWARPEELACMRFISERKRIGAPHNYQIINAFKLGFRAGKESNEG